MMILETLQDKVKKFPALPGVYLMKNARGQVIYVGKAKNLRSRIAQYFSKKTDGRQQIRFLMKRVRDIDFLLCNNEKESLLLENSLIKKHRPRYNIFLKDDKSYVSLKLTAHEFPRLDMTRVIKKDGGSYFGPYASAEGCRETVDFVYRHFQLRTCSDHEFKNRVRPCLEYQIHRCTAPCVGYVSREGYAAQIAPVMLFLKGRNEELIRQVKKKMALAAAREDFENAAIWRDLHRHIRQMMEKQRMVKHGGSHQDLLCLYRQGELAMMVVLTVRGGTLVDSRSYPLKSHEDDATLFGNFMVQRYLTSPFVPDSILTSIPLKQIKVLQEILAEKRGRKVRIRCPKKGEKKHLLNFAATNARAQFQKLLAKEHHTEDTLKSLKSILNLAKIPHHMECYDISNTAGKKATASRVVFVDGHPEKSLYRHYKIRLAEGPDDYAMMHEVLTRRFLPTSDKGPSTVDLLVVDGGKGQLHIALKVLSELQITNIPVIGIAKGQGMGARAKGLWQGKKEEEIYLPHRKNPVILKRGSSELMLLQRLRDEAHRFALRYHRKLRDELGEKN